MKNKTKTIVLASHEIQCFVTWQSNLFFNLPEKSIKLNILVLVFFARIS